MYNLGGECNYQFVHIFIYNIFIKLSLLYK